MEKMITFTSTQFGEVRTVIQDGEPWFVATDVRAALDIVNVSQAVDRLNDDERSMFNIGRQGETNIINEPGLYSLVIRSRKPEAHTFKRWITHEVLPSIHKHGAYLTGDTLEQLLGNPDFGIRLLSDLKAEREQRRKVEAAGKAASGNAAQGRLCGSDSAK